MHQQLNENQQQAVLHVEGPALVLAGAGSGKTKVVIHRIAHLLSMGIMPSDIVAVTFTNKAAKEMEARVAKMQGVSILTTTFHSLGARILRESISLLGYRSDFTILDEEDSEKLIKSVLETHQIKEEKGLVKSLKMHLSHAKNQLLSPDEIVKESLPSKSESVFYEIYPTYQRRLQEINAVDFDDLLFLPNKLFVKDKDTLRVYQQKWLFILIDEYQDTNFAQYSLMKQLVKEHRNIFAVGDPDQSIYSWRGARYENILHFEKDFPGAKVITLNQNYRSTNHILQAANHLIEQNHKRYEKELWSELGDGELISLYIGHTEKDECHFIWQQIQQKAKEDKIPLEEMVIFYRTNAQSRVYEDMLLSKNIPYRIFGGISFYQRKEIKDTLAFLRLLHSPYDILSFARIVPILTSGIGATTVKRMIQHADSFKIPILHLCTQDMPIRLTAAQKEGLHKIALFFEECKKEAASNLSLADLIELILQKSRYKEYLSQDPQSMDDRIENIEALISKAAEWEEEKEHPSLVAFLEEISLRIPKEEEGKGITLMTLHNGKGLEFSLVFMVGMEENLLPHANSQDSFEQLEEERRLCYVGMTRAKRFLFLTAAHIRYLWGSQRMMNLSRFLQEIPREHIIQKKEEGSFTISTDEQGVLSEGSKVRHREFGIGFIKKIYHTSYGLTYDVQFVEGDFTRSLVAKYAKLELI